jgi:replicative DNA helicase
LKFDLEFEDAVLAQALRDEAYLKRAVRICEAHHFGTKEHAWLWDVIHSVWSEYRERAPGKLVAARAQADFPEKDKRKPYLVLARRLFKFKPVGPLAALDELSKFVRLVNAQLALEQGAEALEKGDVDACEQAMAVAARSAVQERNYTHIAWIEGFQERQATRKYEAEHPDEFTVIPTGIARLDRALSGGARLGELGLMMGTTGRGKSIGLNNLIHASISRGFPAVYFGMEMPARQIAMRHDARWLEMRYDQFKAYDFKPSELRAIKGRFARAAKQYANLLHIISMPVRSASILDIRSALDDLKAEYDFTPKLIVVDSGDHLRCTDKGMDSYRLQQAAVYWDQKRLAEEDGYVVWSSVQAGKEWAERIAMAEAASESYDKARIADLVVSINDPNAKSRRRKAVEIETDESDDDVEPEEVEGIAAPGARRMEAWLAKYRDGMSKLRIPLDCDFSRMIVREAVEADE